MKIRTGFVSNSSSSSFAIFGAKIDYSELSQYFGDLDTEDIEDVIGGELEVVREEGDFFYIGKSINEMKDGQTKKEFADSIRNALIEKFSTTDLFAKNKFEKLEIGFHESYE